MSITLLLNKTKQDIGCVIQYDPIDIKILKFIYTWNSFKIFSKMLIVVSL